MSKTKKVPGRVRVKTGGPDHVEILADKAAELAILRVPELASSRPQNGKSSVLFDFIVSADSGICFLVKIESYSASHLKMGEPDAIPVLELSMSADYAWIACHSPTPVVMFLFDGDRGHVLDR